jgi:hypothetical protein
MTRRIELEILRQPDDSMCGPTCLHALYRFYGDEFPIERIIREVTLLETGGTLAVMLACHALARGYLATIYTYNVHIFDPSWFREGVDLREKLRAQLEAKVDPKLRTASRSYLQYLELGGRLRFEELTPRLLRGFLKRGKPILTGLSATYLYRCSREANERYDDVRGEPMGHFVVLCGYEPNARKVLVADPLHDNPGFRSSYYTVELPRLISSILLGIVTYDANLLLIEPRPRETRP